MVRRLILILTHGAASLKRVLFWSAFLGLALVIFLAMRSFSSLLTLNEYRPQVIEFLERTSHAHVIVGNIRAELFPYPGVLAGPVVLSEPAQPTHVFAAAQGVHLWISWRSLLERRIIIGSVRLWKVRLILRRNKTVDGPRWILPTIPIGPQPAPHKNELTQVEIRNGRLEILDHTTTPTSHWVVEKLDGRYRTDGDRGEATAVIPSAGAHNLLSLHYVGGDAFPIQAKLTGVDLAGVRTQLRKDWPWLAGSASVAVKARMAPALEARVTVSPLQLSILKNKPLRTEISLKEDHVHAELRTGTTAPMTLTVDATKKKNAWSAQGAVQNYDGAVVNAIYPLPWANRLQGPAPLSFSIDQGIKEGAWRVVVNGQRFGFAGTNLQLAHWQVHADPGAIQVAVWAQTPSSGTANVVWEKTVGMTDSALNVSVQSLTIREIIDAIKTEPSASTMPPRGYEPWTISSATFQAQLHPGSMDIDGLEMDFLGAHGSVTGTIGWAPGAAQANLEGVLDNVPVGPVLESFTPPPADLTGTGRTTFTMTFPTTAKWLNGLNGQAEFVVDRGVLRGLKALYRIASVLNLGNYFRLRFPNLSAEGVPFDSITGHLTASNGILQTKDMFLKSPNMNMGADGQVDLPGRKIHATVRLQVLRFLEDLLENLSGAKWIFKGNKKILLPLIVTVDGPFDNIDIK
jgi:hypothetical protein